MSISTTYVFLQRGTPIKAVRTKREVWLRVDDGTSGGVLLFLPQDKEGRGEVLDHLAAALRQLMKQEPDEPCTRDWCGFVCSAQEDPFTHTPVWTRDISVHFPDAGDVDGEGECDCDHHLG